MAQSQGYTVKSIAPVAIGSDVQARLFTLAPGETIPWHYHSAVTDWYFVLEGALSIETRAPADHRELAIAPFRACVSRGNIFSTGPHI